MANPDIRSSGTVLARDPALARINGFFHPNLKLASVGNL
jgi:hypothetical protein